jgi:hypothetical protein
VTTATLLHHSQGHDRFEAMLWLKKGFGFSGGWTINDQNDLLARIFGLQKVNNA